MRRSAPLPVLAAAALLPLLLFGATACQSAPEGGALAPAAVPAAPVDDGAPGGDAEDAEEAPGVVRTAAKDAHVGESVRVHGRQVGRHLEAVLNAYVDPAVSVEKNFAPPAGKRWVAASMSFVNVGGASYGALGRMWAHDSAGKRFPVVPTGELTTGKPLVFDSLAVGARAEGWVVFEIPENVQIVRLEYQDTNMQANSGTGFWAV
ncbi:MULTISPECIES: DUF4352 domain-containing protein [unclassified Streptomyces]|uniref:DUF4352 domain-containing protein n=1 Tax=unclassified Streptomyces TaxID=2593676 RepID=UPI001BEAFCBC|nr:MULTISPECIES: DUF4352 domain-containing protein [unclassified Streptomyces]MBT2406392.1 DUF4352 domain-containing protein [Streptomyces sp. ISL-21]MBT2454141.1 DUF4352 domain-containing protein [Streptomyces sp. ISL-86]MBT2607512.1 DUF4352 domain-containing protein [Streptomyces sp. ISL-87]